MSTYVLDVVYCSGMDGGRVLLDSYRHTGRDTQRHTERETHTQIDGRQAEQQQRQQRQLGVKVEELKGEQRVGVGPTRKKDRERERERAKRRAHCVTLPPISGKQQSQRQLPHLSDPFLPSFLPAAAAVLIGTRNQKSPPPPRRPANSRQLLLQPHSEPLTSTI